MKTDDPKLTAYALDELDEPERSTIARAVADSPEAQEFVNETRELAGILKSEFAAELKPGAPTNLIDIRDDPWFWSIARPLSIAAGIAIFAILGAIAIGTYKSRSQSGPAASSRVEYADVETEERPQSEFASDFAGPDNVANPLRADGVKRIEGVVIGEIGVGPGLENGEIRVIETIGDAFRVQKLKERLATRVLSKKPHRGLASREYELIFLDRDGHILASAAFYRAPGLGFVLQPSKHAYERDGHYFSGRGDAILPGDWAPGVDYVGYAIPFPDWNESIGYCPGA